MTVPRVLEFDSVDAFMARAGAVMSGREVENSLPAGICFRLQSGRGYSDTPPRFWTLEQTGRTVGAALMTPPHNLVLCSGFDWPSDAFRALADALAASGTTLPGVIGPAAEAARMASAWSIEVLAEPVAAMRLGLYVLESVAQKPISAGVMRNAGPDDSTWFWDWFRAFHRDCFGSVPSHATPETAQKLLAGGDVFYWEDGGVVSMAAVGRPTWNGITISLVYTPLPLRGRGYASSIVSALSSEMLSRGRRFCTLFTDLSNPTSNHIYGMVGYRPVGEFAEYRLRV